MKPNYQKMIEWLAVVLRCPVCGSKYSAEQTHIVESRDSSKEGDASLLVHSDCAECRSSVVFNISMEGPEMFSVGMVTDLTSKDVERFHQSGKIGTDEVIEFHNYLKKFDGDFKQVFKKK